MMAYKAVIVGQMDSDRNGVIYNGWGLCPLLSGMAVPCRVVGDKLRITGEPIPRYRLSEEIQKLLSEVEG
jgi:hypothetical protein